MTARTRSALRAPIAIAAPLLLGALVGCAPDTPSTQPARAVVEQVDPAERFTTEAWGIGASWYEYDETTHVLTPRDERYRIEAHDVDVLLRIVSYYDTSGTSGHFTLQLWSASDPDAPRATLELAGNVKDAPVCVDVAAAREVSCDAPEAHLVFRTERRVIPEAGFAVAEPGFYLHEPVVGREADVRRVVPGAETAEAPAVPDAWRVPEDAILPSALDLATTQPVQQATRGGYVAQWEIREVRESSGATTVVVAVQCAPMATSADEQVPWSDAPSELELHLDGSADVVGVTLCGDAGGSAALLSPSVAAWPSNTAVDVLFRTDSSGRARAVIAPGSPAFLPPADARASVHRSLWELR